MDSNVGEIELSVVFPCLNEEQSVGKCVIDARTFMADNGIKGEVIVVDNGSSDRSRIKAKHAGARVLTEKKTGYGSAIICGLMHSRGRVIIFADCDLTYDVYHLSKIYEPLCKGRTDVVIGDRFCGGIDPGAMSLSHRFGVPVLSFLGRCRYHVPVRDFHCGLRGVTQSSLRYMNLKTSGMEFATEFIAEASRNGLKIQQVPVTLHAPPKGRSSKLRTVRDGLRHVNYMIFHS